MLTLKIRTEMEEKLKLSEALIYELDNDDHIVSVNQVWQDFALANNAPELSYDQVIGQPLEHYISGNVTKNFWRNFLKKVRLSNSALHLNYRCDSPDLKRFMQIKAYRGSGDSLYFESTLLRSELRTVSIYFKSAKQRGLDTKVRCSFCNNILHKNNWVEAESLVQNKSSLTLDVIYGICPTCQASLDAL